MMENWKKYIVYGKPLKEKIRGILGGAERMGVYVCMSKYGQVLDVFSCLKVDEIKRVTGSSICLGYVFFDKKRCVVKYQTGEKS
jgi:hypothetical protein